jgi:hypothetical protein
MLYFFSAVAASGETKTKLAMLPKTSTASRRRAHSALHLNMLVENSLVRPLLPSHVDAVLLWETLQVVRTSHTAILRQGGLIHKIVFCW